MGNIDGADTYCTGLDTTISTMESTITDTVDEIVDVLNEVGCRVSLIHLNPLPHINHIHPLPLLIWW